MDGERTLQTRMVRARIRVDGGLATRRRFWGRRNQTRVFSAASRTPPWASLSRAWTVGASCGRRRRALGRGPGYRLDEIAQAFGHVRYPLCYAPSSYQFELISRTSCRRMGAFSIHAFWGAGKRSWLGSWHCRFLDFTHFKRHKRGNLQYDGTEWRGVSVHRSWRSIVKNPPTPTTSGYAQR